ncbi:MAG TPA: hypothetical protein VJB15_00500 [Rhodothermia bacterium]|nr:hypothetical protein [Rhodothermia bacterium]
MTRSIGYSTGALAKGDFRLGLAILRAAEIPVVELSALRSWELEPLVSGIENEDMSQFSFVSVHAPSRYDEDAETSVVARLKSLIDRGWPVVVHPDTIYDFSLWRSFGEMVLVENMDTRKSRGRTAAELELVFEQLPKASFCFDAGHARQVDPTMSEARVMLTRFSHRLRQLHVSEVNSVSHHERLSVASIFAFQKVAGLIPDEVPLILETPILAHAVLTQLESAGRAFPARKAAVGVAL